jgi:hypothetical protein
MFVSFEQKIECSPLLVTNVKKEITSLDQSQIIFTGIYRCCSSIYNIFIKYIVFYYEIQVWTQKCAVQKVSVDVNISYY